MRHSDTDMSVIKNIYKKLDAKKKEERRDKLARKLGTYYTLKSLMGVEWATWMWLIGARGRGKSYSVIDAYLSHVKRYGQDNCRCYYFRLSDLSVKAMLNNKASKAIDAKLVRKYNLELSTKGNVIFNRGKPLINMYALVSAAKTGKGVAEYDDEFLGKLPIINGKRQKRFIFIIIDEFMMAEGLEKRTVGNPVEQFKIFVENILRDQAQLDYKAVMIFGCANAVSECSDFLAQLAGFIPEKPGRYKLKRKHMIVDNLLNSQAYIDKRKKSIGGDIMNYEDDSNYTNVVKRDLDTLAPKSIRLRKVSQLIKFSKDKSSWFCLYDNNIIRRYKGETVSRDRIIPMKRYLDELYIPEIVMSIIERYDARDFKFKDMISQATFAANLKLIKPK